MVEHPAVNRRVVGSSPTRGVKTVTMRLWETPVPIPNTTVKPQAADGTWRGTAWESRKLPFFLILRTLSSVGRAPALQAGCHRFEPYSVHAMRVIPSGMALFYICVAFWADFVYTIVKRLSISLTMPAAVR